MTHPTPAPAEPTPALAPAEPTPAPAEPTVSRLFTAAVARWADRTAFRVHRDGAWPPITFAEYGQAVRDGAAGLLALGLEPGDFGAIVSGNRPEWHECDMAMVLTQVVGAPVYTTSSAAQVGYILEHTASRVAFVEDEAQRAKVDAVRDGLPALAHCVVFSGEGCDGAFFLSWGDLLARGAAARPAADAEVDRRVQAARPEDLLATIYTSGTTGPPKGAMISHHNQVFVCASLDLLTPSTPEQRKLSFLPLSHVGERQISEYLQLQQGFEIWFAECLETVGRDLAACRPHVQFVVPRILEKQYDAARAGLDRAPDAAEAWEAVGRGLERARLRERGEPVPDGLDAAFGEAEDRWFRPLRRTLGYDDLVALWSGGAPLSTDVLHFFQSVGVPLLELYGLTEVAGPMTFNRVERYRFGTVGHAIPGGRVRLADDGEICYRGDNVCMGYYRRPDATAELVDADGWLHSGDIGSLDDDGFLTITDRKKDLLITSGGKNVAPQVIEAKLKFSPWVSQAMVVGDRRKYVAALLTLDDEAVRDHGIGQQAADETADDVHTHPDVFALVQAHVAQVNTELSHAEQVKRFRILPQELSVEDGTLTPTMKVRRQVIAERYADVIESLYAEPGS